MGNVHSIKIASEFFFIYLSFQKQLSAKALEDELLGMPVSFTPLSNSIEDFKMTASKVESQRKVPKWFSVLPKN